MHIEDKNLISRLRKSEDRIEGAVVTTMNAAAARAATDTPSYIRSRIRRPNLRLISKDVAKAEKARPGSLLARVYVSPDRVEDLRELEFGSPARTINKPVAPEASDGRGGVIAKFEMTPANLASLKNSSRYFVGRPKWAKYDFSGIFERRFQSFKTMTAFEDVPARPPRLHLRRHWRSILPEMVKNEAEKAFSDLNGEI